MNWINKLFGTIFGGDDFDIGTGADADATAAKVNGAIAFKPTITGGPFGSGYGSICYRITVEPNMDPSFVHRFYTYTWECSDLTWMMNLNKTGLMIGGLVHDPVPYPTQRLDVRKGNASIEGCLMLADLQPISPVPVIPPCSLFRYGTNLYWRDASTPPVDTRIA